MIAFCGIAESSLLECKGRFLVTVAIDKNADRASKFLSEVGCDAPLRFDSLTEALQENKKQDGKLFNTIDIIVPHNVHEEVATEALRSGLNVILEKPISTTLESALRILDEGRKAKDKFGSVFMVAENSEYWPDVVLAKTVIDSGAIGKLIHARAVYNEEMPKQGSERFASERQESKSSEKQADADEISGRLNPFGELKPWRFRLEANGGGVAIDGGAHWLRPLRIFMGELDEVIACTSRIFDPMEGETLVRAIFRARGNSIATFECTMTDVVFAPEPLWLIQGSEGAIAIQREGGVILYTRECRSGKQMMEKSEPRGYLASFTPQMRDFADVVQKKSSSLKAEPEKALGELRCAFAIYRSATSGKWEKVWE